jgi:hypothetical protein
MSSDLRRLWESIEDPDFHAAENRAHPPPQPFTIVSGAELRALALPPRIDVLGTGVIALGQLTTIIGQGGTGKSRFVMQVAISQILGWSVAGLPTHREPLRHLLIGTENSIYRQQGDYVRMTAPLTAEQRARVDAGVFFHVVREIDDAFIHLGSDDIKRRWLDTLQQVQPDCIYIDPYGEVHVGDINKDADVRATLREITKVCRRFNQHTAIVIVHHARTGRQNIAQAVGWDKGNFGLGSKALYSGARSQINLAPADPDDPSRIVLSCGKSNDARPFPPVGLRLNEQTMLYDLDPSFDLQAWKDDVEGKRTNANFTLAQVATAIAEGANKPGQIHENLGGVDAGSRRSLERILSKGKSEGYFRVGRDGYRLMPKGQGIVAQASA